jgi:hypothetical protein
MACSLANPHPINDRTQGIRHLTFGFWHLTFPWLNPEFQPVNLGQKLLAIALPYIDLY